MADLKFIGRILGVIGGIIMVIVGIIIAINNLMDEILDMTTLGLNAAGQFLGEGEFTWVVSAAVMIVCGLIAIYGYKELGAKKKEKLLLWGIIYIVLAILGGGLGALLVFIGGIILLIDYFI
ncbi:MAG: hypothetical protein ACXACU_17880 [Candidatus Hodarchaeales archaeon]|jgi:hypothetical protein